MNRKGAKSAKDATREGSKGRDCKGFPLITFFALFVSFAPLRSSPAR